MRPWVRRTALGALVLSSVCVVRAASMTPPTVPSRSLPALPELDAEILAASLADAIAVPTVSLPSGGAPEAFERLHALLRARHPTIYAACEVERVGLSLLMRWPGRDPTRAPIILTAHLDVVPAPADDWTHPPFAGTRADGFVWGRGALDDKLGVIGLLAATESLARAGFVPGRDVYLAFGHDEEVGGPTGAVVLAERLRARGVHAEFVLDEGGAIASGVLPGVERPVALIGIAEKGFATVEMTARGEGGHSSMPPPHGAIGRVARAVERLEAAPLPTDLRGPSRAMIERLGAELGLVPKLALANLWLFAPAVRFALSRHPAANAIVRTTTAVTMFDAGTAANVLAPVARATANFRILPGDTVDGVMAHVRAEIDDDAIELRCVDCWDPSPVSRTDAPAYLLLEQTIGALWPEAIVSPSLVVGATDARHYAGVADDVYRFLPIRMQESDRARLHGVDERIAEADLVLAARFYQALLTAAAG